MAFRNMTKEQRQWQAQDDARTMATYQEILQDKARMGRAIKEANRQATDLNKRAAAMKSAANVKARGGSVSRRKK